VESCAVDFEYNNLTEEQKKRLLQIAKEEEREKEIAEETKKNSNFIQLYRDNLPELRWLMSNYAFASSVLFFILEFMDGKNVLACPNTVMMEYFSKSKSSILRAIKVLDDNGFLTVMKLGTTNVYIVNTQVAWTSYSNQKTGASITYSNLDGNMLISKKENMDYDLRQQNERFKALGNQIAKSKKKKEPA